jgi:anti-sigma factor (TIGR02949 family)
MFFARVWLLNKECSGFGLRQEFSPRVPFDFACNISYSMTVNCSEIQDLAAALVDHESLGARDLAEVEQHLKTCTSCQYEYEMDLMTSHIVRSRIPLVDAPSEARERVLLAIEAD